MDGLWWKTLLKWMIWGYHYFWKHPYSMYPLVFTNIAIAAKSSPFSKGKYVGSIRVHFPASYVSLAECFYMSLQVKQIHVGKSSSPTEHLEHIIQDVACQETSVGNAVDQSTTSKFQCYLKIFWRFQSISVEAASWEQQPVVSRVVSPCIGVKKNSYPFVYGHGKEGWNNSIYRTIHKASFSIYFWPYIKRPNDL